MVQIGYRANRFPGLLFQRQVRHNTNGDHIVTLGGNRFISFRLRLLTEATRRGALLLRQTGRLRGATGVISYYTAGLLNTFRRGLHASAIT